MSVDYHINSDQGLITVRAQGDVDLNQVYTLGLRLLLETEFEPGLPQLIDMRGARLNKAGKNFEPFTSFVINHYGPKILASIAIVVDCELLPDEYAAVYRLACALDRAEMFDDYDHALRWLIKREFASCSGE